ncbi:MAG: RHS repeat-associated core domain-containing protein [Nitrospira sp.]|nr:RHS repeat-associated core domain-containing protein [Nitrospira sp.]
MTIGYDNASRRTTVTYPNTNSLLYGYNDANDLTSLTYKQGATTVGDLTYTYDPAGRRTSIGGTFARASLPPALTTATYNANNQQKVFGTNTLNYDLNGNLNTVTDPGGTSTYTWNVRNQLTGLSATGFAATFSYDSFGRRTGKTVQGTTTNFLYDGLNPVQEKNGATVTANLLTGLNIDEFFTRTDGVGVRALLPDALGSTVALGDNTGTLQTQYTYEPFGFASQTGLASTNSYKYTGREEDGTGLVYYRARYYHPRLQRFISEDPIGFNGGDANLYGYVSNNSITNIDPSGQIGIAGFIVGLSIDAFMQYQLTGTVNSGQALIAGAAGAIGAGVSAQIAQAGIAGVRSVILNAGSGLAIGGAGQVATNLVKGCDWDRGLARSALLNTVLSGGATALINQLTKSALVGAQSAQPGFINLANTFLSGHGNPQIGPQVIGVINAIGLVINNSAPLVQ